MKKIFFYFLGVGVLFFMVCAHESPEKITAHPASPPVLTGWLTEPQIVNQIKEYHFEKQKYQPDSGTIEKLKNDTTNIQIMVFLGTWCSDSRREVPRFLKLMDLIPTPHITYKLFGLDRSKRDPEGLAEKYQIEFVPTFIVLHQNQEIGRIVEMPTVSIEQDLLEILSTMK